MASKLVIGYGEYPIVDMWMEESANLRKAFALLDLKINASICKATRAQTLLVGGKQI